MVNEHTKECSTSLVVSKMKITMRYRHTRIRIAQMKDFLRVDKDARERELSYTTSGVNIIK